MHWLGGVNTIADKGVRLIYADVDLAQRLAEGEEVRVVSLGRVAARAWREGFSSVAETYADLFAMPGWQARQVQDRTSHGDSDRDRRPATGAGTRFPDPLLADAARFDDLVQALVNESG